MLQDLPVWLAHFRSQAAHPRQVPATLDDTLTLRERRLIEASIATFQLGESSDGAQLRRAVRRHCDSQPDHALAEIFSTTGWAALRMRSSSSGATGLYCIPLACSSESAFSVCSRVCSF